MGILDFANCIAAAIALSHAPCVGSAQSFQAARGRTHAVAKRVPDIEAGIYVRPSVTLNEMWKHFRKLTGLQYERGKWLYFRFWEVKSYTAPFDHRPSISAIPLTLITPDEGDRIACTVIGRSVYKNWSRERICHPDDQEVQ